MAKKRIPKKGVAKKSKRPVQRNVRGARPARDGDGNGDTAPVLSETISPEIREPEQVEAEADDMELSTLVTLNPPPFTVVGVGASAGGLEASIKVLEAVGPGSGLAVIIVQHLSPKHESMLPELLDAKSGLRVVQAADGMQIHPDHVYVMPPDVQMGLLDGRLHLVARPTDHTRHTPIDYFFRTLAEHGQNRTIAVVLSGTGSDGMMGLRDVKAQGGFVIVQEPRTAKYDGMPRAAIATGLPDLVLPPEQIGLEMMRLGQQQHQQEQQEQLAAGRVARPAEAFHSGDEKLTKIFQLLRQASGVDFTHYKLPTIRRRLQRRMALQKADSIEDYLNLLQKNPAEVQALYQDILIHVTRFFRDPESFDLLKTRVFHRLLEGRPTDAAIRVWVPGCSTGEEAYSLAIAITEYLAENDKTIPVQVFATDVSESAIEQARAGVYPESITGDVSLERMRKYFIKSDGIFRIHKSIRDACIFARQDLTRDPPFSKLDLIVCRNVLIYLGAPLQKKLMTIFHYALKPHGFLMLGTAETIGPYSDLFAIMDKKHKLYSRKLAVVRADLEFTAMEYGAAARAESKRGGGGGGVGADVGGEGRGGSGGTSSTLLTEANRLILNRFSPPGVIVDNDMRIVQFRGQTGKFLEPAPGEASLNMLKMAREGLLYGLRTALHEARKRDVPVRKSRLRVKYNGGVRDVNLEVIPLPSMPDGRYYLVLFDDVTARNAAAADEHHSANSASASTARGRKKAAKQRAGFKPAPVISNQKILQLQQELAANRDYLQSIIQDLEAANEELQSANEEILSSNEELQSTNEELDTAKEELQSTNEELNTVNEELQARNEELSRVNSDLVNLLASVQIAIVMVTADLRIRRFTPMAERVLNLIPSDIGRPISDIKPTIDVPDLEKLIVEVIESVTIREFVVTDRKGHRFQLRIRPYKNLENRIDGAVLVLFAVTQGERDMNLPVPPDQDAWPSGSQ